jgi:hypothetical protein
MANLRKRKTIQNRVLRAESEPTIVAFDAAKYGGLRDRVAGAYTPDLQAGQRVVDQVSESCPSLVVAGAERAKPDLEFALGDHIGVAVAQEFSQSEGIVSCEETRTH